MHLEISLAKCNGNRALVTLENDNGEQVDVCERGGARRACMDAAALLRTAADKLERLADEPRPYSVYTQTRINRCRISANARI